MLPKAGEERLSENDVIMLSQKLDAVQKELSNLNAEVAGLKSTVKLLVDGKIKDSKHDEALGKVAVSAIDVVKAIALGLIGAISGYFAGKGGVQ